MKTQEQMNQASRQAEAKYMKASQTLTNTHADKLMAVKKWYDRENAKVWNKYVTDVEAAKRPEN